MSENPAEWDVGSKREGGAIEVLSLGHEDMRRLNWNILEEKLILGNEETDTGVCGTSRTSRQQYSPHANGHLVPQRKQGTYVDAVSGWGSTSGKGQWDTPGRSGLPNKAPSASEAELMADVPVESLRESTLATFPDLGAAILYGNMSNFYFFLTFLCLFSPKMLTFTFII